MQGKHLVLIIIAISLIGVFLAWFLLKDVEPIMDKQESNALLYEIKNTPTT